MRWPWQRNISGDTLVFSWADQTLTYVLARRQLDGSCAVLKLGAERQGSDNLATFVQRLQGLGLKGQNAIAMLASHQYQFLQIDTPAVPPEELRSAARYQIREMLQTHVDDVTIDVVRVGDDAHQGGTVHSFVVAAPNTVVRSVLDLGAAMDCPVSVIDVQEMAQRNLQCALAQHDGQPDRANAALVLVPGQQALLTISANDELFYTRRFDVPEGFLTSVWGQGVVVAAPVDGFTPVEEYVPSYGMGDVALGDDYAGVQPSLPALHGVSHADDERAQRLVVEVQRSLDVWDRTWSSLPLRGLRVFAGERTTELAQWLTQQLGQAVSPLEVGTLFPGFEAAPVAQQALCLPLLGVLLRTEGGKS
jgi:MSHA biogenesis protein MshI